MWEILRNLNSNPNYDQQIEEVRSDLSEKKGQTNPFIRNFLKRTLTSEQMTNTIQDSFLYINLREIKKCRIQDIKHELSKKENKGKYRRLVNFLDNKVSPFN